MEELQNRLSERAQWFRVGIMSATMLTPLITRWRSLRAAERARDLWESRRTGGQWPWIASRTEAAPPAVARRQNVSASIWLVGTGVGLVVAGTLAFVIARRRIRASDDAPLELSLEPGSNGTSNPAGEPARELVGYAAVIGRASAATGDAGPAAPEEAPAPRMSPVADPLPPDTDEALFIGDVKTLVYHDADGDNLPAEENRVYFANQEQAEAAGFRPVNGEIVPPEVTR